MKKIGILFLILFIVASVLIACGGNGTEPSGTTTGDVAYVTEGGTETAEGGDDLSHGLQGWFAYGSELVERDTYTVDVRDEIAISMAKNEKEGFQYILAAGEDLSDVRCEVSILTDGNGNTLEGTVYVAYDFFLHRSATRLRGYRPFALLEQDHEYVGGTVDLTANRAKTLYVQYITDENTVPGTYTGTLEIKQGDAVLKSGDVSVTVWDIFYPDDTIGEFTFGYGYLLSDTIQGNGPHAVGPENAPAFDYEPQYAEPYFNFMCDNRTGPSINIYGNLLSEDAYKVLDNPRTSLIWIHDHNDLEAQYEVAKANDWLDKLYFCEFDEPHAEGHVQNIIGKAAELNAKFPTTNHLNAFYINLPLDGKNVVERFAEFSTLHCAKLNNFASGDVIGTTMQRLKAERGDTILWYTCGDSPLNAIDILPEFPGTDKRTLYWQQYLYDIDGYLYWNSTNWYGFDNIWEEGYADKRHGFPSMDTNSGNGVLYYFDPITKLPVATLGSEAVRDGIEDYQLIRLADEVLGRETVLTYIRQITTSITDYNKDAAVLMQVRDALAEALLAATSQA